MGNRTKIHTRIINRNNTTTKSNYALFADDASIDSDSITQLQQLLDIYNESTNEYALIIQWAKVMIPKKQKLLIQFRNYIRTLPRP